MLSVHAAAQPGFAQQSPARRGHIAQCLRRRADAIEAADRTAGGKDHGHVLGGVGDTVGPLHVGPDAVVGLRRTLRPRRPGQRWFVLSLHPVLDRAPAVLRTVCDFLQGADAAATKPHPLIIMDAEAGQALRRYLPAVPAKAAPTVGPEETAADDGFDKTHLRIDDVSGSATAALYVPFDPVRLATATLEEVLLGGGFAGEAPVDGSVLLAQFSAVARRSPILAVWLAQPVSVGRVASGFPAVDPTTVTVEVGGKDKAVDIFPGRYALGDVRQFCGTAERTESVRAAGGAPVVAVGLRGRAPELRALRLVPDLTVEEKSAARPAVPPKGRWPAVLATNTHHHVFLAEALVAAVVDNSVAAEEEGEGSGDEASNEEAPAPLGPDELKAAAESLPLGLAFCHEATGLYGQSLFTALLKALRKATHVDPGQPADDSAGTAFSVPQMQFALVVLLRRLSGLSGAVPSEAEWITASITGNAEGYGREMGRGRPLAPLRSRAVEALVRCGEPAREALSLFLSAASDGPSAVVLRALCDSCAAATRHLSPRRRRALPSDFADKAMDVAAAITATFGSTEGRSVFDGGMETPGRTAARTAARTAELLQVFDDASLGLSSVLCSDASFAAAVRDAWLGVVGTHRGPGPAVTALRQVILLGAESGGVSVPPVHYALQCRVSCPDVLGQLLAATKAALSDDGVALLCLDGGDGRSLLHSALTARSVVVWDAVTGAAGPEATVKACLAVSQRSGHGGLLQTMCGLRCPPEVPVRIVRAVEEALAPRSDGDLLDPASPVARAVVALAGHGLSQPLDDILSRRVSVVGRLLDAHPSTVSGAALSHATAWVSLLNEALRKACSTGTVCAVKVLTQHLAGWTKAFEGSALRRYGITVLNTAGPCGRAPLALACHSGKHSAITALLEAGAHAAGDETPEASPLVVLMCSPEWNSTVQKCVDALMSAPGPFPAPTRALRYAAVRLAPFALPPAIATAIAALPESAAVAPYVTSTPQAAATCAAPLLAGPHWETVLLFGFYWGDGVTIRCLLGALPEGRTLGPVLQNRLMSIAMLPVLRKLQLKAAAKIEVPTLPQLGNDAVKILLDHLAHTGEALCLEPPTAPCPNRATFLPKPRALTTDGSDDWDSCGGSDASDSDDSVEEDNCLGTTETIAVDLGGGRVFATPIEYAPVLFFIAATADNGRFDRGLIGIAARLLQATPEAALPAFAALPAAHDGTTLFAAAAASMEPYMVNGEVTAALLRVANALRGALSSDTTAQAPARVAVPYLRRGANDVAVLSTGAVHAAVRTALSRGLDDVAATMCRALPSGPPCVPRHTAVNVKNNYFALALHHAHLLLNADDDDSDSDSDSDSGTDIAAGTKEETSVPEPFSWLRPVLQSLVVQEAPGRYFDTALRIADSVVALSGALGALVLTGRYDVLSTYGPAVASDAGAPVPQSSWPLVRRADPAILNVTWSCAIPQSITARVLLHGPKPQGKNAAAKHTCWVRGLSPLAVAVMAGNAATCESLVADGYVLAPQVTLSATAAGPAVSTVPELALLALLPCLLEIEDIGAVDLTHHTNRHGALHALTAALSTVHLTPPPTAPFARGLNGSTAAVAVTETLVRYHHWAAVKALVHTGALNAALEAVAADDGSVGRGLWSPAFHLFEAVTGCAVGPALSSDTTACGSPAARKASAAVDGDAVAVPTPLAPLVLSPLAVFAALRNAPLSLTAVLHGLRPRGVAVPNSRLAALTAGPLVGLMQVGDQQGTARIDRGVLAWLGTRPAARSGAASMELSEAFTAMWAQASEVDRTACVVRLLRGGCVPLLNVIMADDGARYLSTEGSLREAVRGGSAATVSVVIAAAQQSSSALSQADVWGGIRMALAGGRVEAVRTLLSHYRTISAAIDTDGCDALVADAIQGGSKGVAALASLIAQGPKAQLYPAVALPTPPRWAALVEAHLSMTAQGAATLEVWDPTEEGRAPPIARSVAGATMMARMLESS